MHAMIRHQNLVHIVLSLYRRCTCHSAPSVCHFPAICHGSFSGHPDQRAGQDSSELSPVPQDHDRGGAMGELRTDESVEKAKRIITNGPVHSPVFALFDGESCIGNSITDAAMSNGSATVRCELFSKETCCPEEVCRGKC